MRKAILAATFLLAGCSFSPDAIRVSEYNIDDVIANVRSQLVLAGELDPGSDKKLPIKEVVLSFSTSVRGTGEGTAGVEAQVAEFSVGGGRETSGGNTVEITLKPPFEVQANEKIRSYLAPIKMLATDGAGAKEADRSRLAEIELAQTINVLREDVLKGLGAQGPAIPGCVDLTIGLDFSTKDSIKLEGGVNFLIFKIEAGGGRATESGSTLKLSFSGGDACEADSA